MLSCFRLRYTIRHEATQIHMPEVQPHMDTAQRRISETLRTLPQSVLEQRAVWFWRHVQKTEKCWLWTAQVSWRGYGRFRVLDGPRGTMMAHRFSYQLLIGPIPRGLTLDHLCREKRCVNPEHLEVVTLRENILRGNSLPAINARKTHCKRGHCLSGKNVVITTAGYRNCRECNNERRRIHSRALLKEEA